MIQIEAASASILLTKLVEAKTLVKLSSVDPQAIRVNKNIASALLQNALIFAETPSFYRLTKKGLKTAKEIEFIEAKIPLELYLRFANQEELVKQYLKPKYKLFKIMITTCFSCGNEDKNVEHILDNEGNEGSYCKSCLYHGYPFAVNAMRQRRANVNG